MRSKLLGGAAIVLVTALASGQSLGDAAQKERERRQKLKTSGKNAEVITEESLKANKGSLANDPGAAQPSPPPSTEPGAAEAPAPAAKAASPTPRPPAVVRPALPVVSEQEWRGRAAETRRRIADRQRRYDYVAGLRLRPDELFVDENGKRAAASPENLQKAIATAQAQLDAAKQDLEDLQEEARRQNVPPGLLR